MTHSPVVAPRQVELLVSPLSGTIGATTGDGIRARQALSGGAVAG